MSARNEFTDDNFIRAMHHANQARILAFRLAPQIEEITKGLFDRAPRISAAENQGWRNPVLTLDGEAGAPRYVLRLSAIDQEDNSRSTSAFEKECHILRLLEPLGLTPTVPAKATGRITIENTPSERSEYGYMLESLMPFNPPRTDLQPRERLYILRQLGEILKAVHSTTLKGFGSKFDEATGSMSHPSIRELIANKISSVEGAPIEATIKHWMVERLEGLEQCSDHSRLFHFDLLGNWGNLLVDDRNNVKSILDWEYAGAGAAFQHEVGSWIYAMLRDGGSRDEIDHDLAGFLHGYGMSFETYKEHYEYGVETIVLYNAISALRKYETSVRSGIINKEPWRKVFAERAERICLSSFHNDYRRVSRQQRSAQA